MSSRPTCRFLCAGLVLLLLAGSARADDGRSKFREGVELYEDGFYARALEAFNEGYRIDSRPEFLINIAQCHRALGDIESAIASLEKFLRDAPADHRLRATVEESLEQFRKERKARADRDAPQEGPVDLRVPDREPANEPAAALAGEKSTDDGGSNTWLWIGALGTVAATAIVLALVLPQDDRGGEAFDTIVLPPP